MKSFRNTTLAGVLFAVALSAFSLVGCGKSEPTAPEPTATSSQPATPQPASSGLQITAEPNPVPAGPDKGKTTITWNAGPGNTCEVYLVTKDGGEKLFGGIAPRGRQEVAWIAAGGVYEFRMYEGKEHKKLLGSVTVTREKNKK